MLKQPDRSVTAVMEEIGYSNITHFYKIFGEKVPYDTSGIPKYFISPVYVLSVYSRKEKCLIILLQMICPSNMIFRLTVP